VTETAPYVGTIPNLTTLDRTAHNELALNNAPGRPASGGANDGAGDRNDYYFTLVNSLAHEIRNPLNALSVNLNLLSRQIGDGPGTEKLDAALREVRRLDELLTAFLRFARPKVPKARELQLGVILTDLETFIAPVAATSGVKLEFGPVADVTVQTDPDLLKQALLNVILNSFEAGASRVDVVAEDCGDDVVVAVRDDGPGLAEPARAFEPFYSTKPEGSGLGLPTARAIARSLGGRLEPGDASVGVELKFTIPKKASL
jgi:two-component system sensor histidine kinase HydH